MCNFAITLLLVLVYSVSPAHALIPDIPPSYKSTSNILTVPDTSLSLHYAMTPADISTNTVDASGNIYRKSQVAWIGLGVDGKTPTLEQKSITAKMTDTNARSIAAIKNSDGTYKYPKLNDAYNIFTGGIMVYRSCCIRHWPWIFRNFI